MNMELSPECSGWEEVEELERRVAEGSFEQKILTNL
jgi:hypothetical protein